MTKTKQGRLVAMAQESQTMGPQVALFQKEFAKIFEVKHALAATNCTTAMHAATQAFGIGKGDEVIVWFALLKIFLKMGSG